MGNPNKLVREAPIDPEDFREVTLGEKQYVMLPQPIGHLRSQLGVALGNIDNIELDADNVLDMLTDKAYAVLKVFQPDLMPEYEFNGYATNEDFEAKKYNREYDKSPTPRQIKKAFKAAAELNEIDLLKHLGKILGPDLIRGLVGEALKRSIMDSEISSTSSAPNTESTPESSSTPSPTSSDGSSTETTDSAGPRPLTSV